MFCANDGDEDSPFVDGEFVTGALNGAFVGISIGASDETSSCGVGTLAGNVVGTVAMNF